MDVMAKESEEAVARHQVEIRHESQAAESQIKMLESELIDINSQLKLV
jgi:hypothetical protein